MAKHMREQYPHKLITLTGLDRVGKETQSKLLTAALRPSERITFPDYTHWGGRIVRAILQQQKFYVLHENELLADPQEITCGINGVAGIHPELFQAGGSWEWDSFEHFQVKQPAIFQMLQAVDRVHWQDAIRAALTEKHLVADRYTVDAQAYGRADGCSVAWLNAMEELYYPSDLTIVLVGQPFARPGETPDINERDLGFQARVRGHFEDVVRERPRDHFLVDVDPLRAKSPAFSMWQVHEEICRLVRRETGIPVRSLNVRGVIETLGLSAAPVTGEPAVA